MGHFGWGLGVNQRWDSGEEQSEREFGRRHRLGMSVYRRSREKGRGNRE
jgi:hypothetical protein